MELLDISTGSDCMTWRFTFSVPVILTFFNENIGTNLVG